MDNLNGYKAFEPGMICKGKQYQENTDYEEEDGKICEKGMMHYCVNPFDVLNFYPLVNDSGKVSDFAAVKALEKPVEGDNGKFATRKLHIGVKLGLPGFVEACIDYLKEETIGKAPNSTGSSGYYAKIGSSGDSAQIGSSGDYAQIGSSGDSAQIGSSGYYAQIGSSGYYAKIGSSGYYAKIGSSGDYAKIESAGEDSVICCAGHGSAVNAKAGSWITLAEWEYSEDKNGYVPKFVKTEYVDGERIKADTWYKLIDGEFTEVSP
nr:MAG TPA: hypothetical protein [Caudoviricetes sp.]